MTQLASDNFTRANSTGLGANWTAVPSRGTFDIVSNLAVCHDQTADSAMVYNPVSWPNDQYSRIIVGSIPVGGVDAAGIGCIARASTAATTFYRAFATGTNGHIYIRKTLAGTGTLLNSGAGSVVTGSEFILRCFGGATTTLQVWINGVLALSATDASSPILSGSAGIHYSSNDVNSDSISLWTGGDFGPPVQPLTAGAMNVQVCS